MENPGDQHYRSRSRETWCLLPRGLAPQASIQNRVGLHADSCYGDKGCNQHREQVSSED